jgi:hypothetical protein
MARQSRLEQEAITSRNNLLVKNDYQKGEDTEYSVNHKDALSDGDVKGKGTGMPMGIAQLPGASGSKGINYSVINTQAGGGKYDIEGRDGKGGRKSLTLSNLYGPTNPYGAESLDTSANVKEGQIVLS